MQIATFHAGDTYMGMNILLVKEVHRPLLLSKVPGSPEQISGLVNLRGKIVTVLDLLSLLGNEPRKNTEGSRLLILKMNSELRSIHGDLVDVNLKTSDDIVALMIDRMDEVIEISNDEILPPPSNMSDSKRDVIEGVVKLEDKLVLMLDVKKVSETVIAAADDSSIII